MAVPVIRLRRSSVQGAVPSTAQLDLGEVAINTFDGKLFLKKDNGTESIVEVGAGGGGGELSNVVEDTTPQLGGDLDLNSNNVTGTGNINITGSITATSNVQTDGSFRAESSDSTQRFEMFYNESADSLDFSYFAS